MTKLLTELSPTDPVAIPEQKDVIDKIITANRDVPGAIMVVLNDVQNKIGFISPSMQVYIAQQLKVPLGAVHGVVTFYSFFSTQPRRANIRSSFVWARPVM